LVTSNQVFAREYNFLSIGFEVVLAALATHWLRQRIASIVEYSLVKLQLLVTIDWFSDGADSQSVVREFASGSPFVMILTLTLVGGLSDT